MSDERVGKTTRAPVAAMQFENGNGAHVLCDDGSLFVLNFETNPPTWQALAAPLPGSLAAQGWSPANGS